MIIIIILVVISENFIIYSIKPKDQSKKKETVCSLLKRTLFTFLNVSSPPLQTTPKRRISTTAFDDGARAHISIVSFHRVY